MKTSVDKSPKPGTDLKTALKTLYTASRNKVAEVDVPPISYLMIDGKGDPNTSQEYQEAVQALFATSYGLKFAAKRAGGPSTTVMPLECLWWSDGQGAPDLSNKKDWHWTAMIAQQQFVTQQLLETLIKEVTKKKDFPALQQLRLESLAEGTSLQVLHVGRYSEEGDDIALLFKQAQEQHYRPAGKHHEIYLNTPDRTAPEKLKTILRQPVSK